MDRSNADLTWKWFASDLAERFCQIIETGTANSIEELGNYIHATDQISSVYLKEYMIAVLYEVDGNRQDFLDLLEAIRKSHREGDLIDYERSIEQNWAKRQSWLGKFKNLIGLK